MLMYYEIEPSNNPKEKDDIYIWISFEERSDETIQNQIKEWQKVYCTTVFKCGLRDPNIFFQQFLDFATL